MNYLPFLLTSSQMSDDRNLEICVRSMFFSSIALSELWFIYYVYTDQYYGPLLILGLFFSFCPIYFCKSSDLSGKIGVYLALCVTLFLVAFSIFIDIPSGSVPRTTHLYLPVVALFSYLNYLRRPLRWHLVVIAFACSAYVVISSGALVFATSYQINESARQLAAFSNPACAVIISSLGIFSTKVDYFRGFLVRRLARQAMEKGDLVPYLQPQVDCAGALIGAEMLIRWNRPGVGILSPAEFLPALEHHGCMREVDGWLFVQAFEILKAWSQSRETRSLTLSINIGAENLMRRDMDKDLALASAIFPDGVPKLKIELTERAVVSDVSLAVERLTSLRALGYRMSLDDFGAGYSSLNYLHDLPLDEIKIDKELINGLVKNCRANIVLKKVCEICHGLGFDVIAEGIENEHQFLEMKKFGVCKFQGYYFGKPMPVDNFLCSAKVNYREFSATAS